MTPAPSLALPSLVHSPGLFQAAASRLASSLIAWYIWVTMACGKGGREEVLPRRATTMCVWHTSAWCRGKCFYILSRTQPCSGPTHLHAPCRHECIHQGAQAAQVHLAGARDGQHSIDKVVVGAGRTRDSGACRGQKEAASRGGTRRRCLTGVVQSSWGSEAGPGTGSSSLICASIAVMLTVSASPSTQHCVVTHPAW